MDIVAFFELSSGKWFSHQTNHHLALNQSENGKSDVQIELLPHTDPAVIQLCEQHHTDPVLALCGARITWSGTMGKTNEKRAGSTLLVPIADAAQPNQGKLLRDGEAVAAVSRYSLGADEALTLITESDALYAEERLWFVSPNVRLRTSAFKQAGGFSTASFYSEIRMGGAKPTPEAAAAGADTQRQS